MSYVKFNITDKLKDKIKSGLEKIAKTRDSKIRKGMNETTKSIERDTAKLVIMAEDVSPPEILFHVPILCEEKGIAYGYVNTKKELGNAVRINVDSSAIAVEKEGTGNEALLNDLIGKIKEIK